MTRGGCPLKLACAIAACSIAATAAAQHRRHSPARRSPRVPEAQNQAAPEDVFASAIRANNLGMALMDRHEFTKALGRFQTACIMDPAADTGCLNMGIALLYMGQLKDARNILAKSVQRDSNNPRAWFNLGLVERADGRDGAAASDFEKTAMLDPSDSETQYLIGAIYLKAKQYQQALASFRKAADLNPFNLPAEFGMAQAEGRMGDINGALEHLNRAEHLTETNLGRPASTAYGEQGKYSLAQELRAPPPPAPAAITVHFVDVTRISGLPWSAPVATSQHRALSKRRSKTSLAASLGRSESLADFLGGGACVFDYSNDGQPDIFLADADGKGHARLYRNTGHGRFIDATKAADLQIQGKAIGCTTGDYDNDGYADLAVSLADGVQLFRNNGDGTFTDVTESAGLNQARGLVLGMTFFDSNADGDLDLFAARFPDLSLKDPTEPFAFPANTGAPGDLFWRGSDRGDFVDVTKAAGLAGTAPSIEALPCDLNNDGAIDLVVTGWDRSPSVYLSQREGAFRAITPWRSPMPGPTAGAVALDFDHDGRMDLAFTHWSSPGLSLWRNVDGKSFERVRLPGPQWMRGWGLAAVDYDRDGWTDLVAVGETFSGQGRIILLRNLGGDGHGGFAGFRDVTHETGLDKIHLKNPRSVVAFANEDGSTDLLITQNGAPPVLLKGAGSNKNNLLELSLVGARDNREGIGSVAKIFSGVRRQTIQVGGSSGYLGQGPAKVTAGVNQDRGADVVRVFWPSGMVQDEIDVLTGNARPITETARGTHIR